VREETVMKKAAVLGWIVLMGVWQMGLAQEMGKKATPPKAAPGPSEAVLEQWNDIGRKVVAMAEDFPEDRYDFKPAPSVHSFAERLIHAAHVNYFFTDLARGEKGPAMDDPKREQYKTKADVVAFVKKSFADGAEAIKAKGDQGMSDLVVDPFANEQSRISDFAYGFVEHSGEIYGQLTVYYRVAGLVPPESRPKK
jgi:uncharacterized damage-inducible protein DinB